MRRLFFALLPDAETIRAIDYHTHQYSSLTGKKVKPENYHITILFLGNVDEKTHDGVLVACDSIQSGRLTLEIDEAGYWSKQGILWLGPQETSIDLLNLVDETRQAVNRKNLPMKKTQYHPHITLMRNVKTAPQHPLVKPFSWEANSFSLVQSYTHPEGVQYRELACWPLL